MNIQIVLALFALCCCQGVLGMVRGGSFRGLAALHQRSQPQFLTKPLKKQGSEKWDCCIKNKINKQTSRSRHDASSFALKSCFIMSSGSFLQSAIILVPIGLLLNVQMVRADAPGCFRKGAAVGLEWSKVGAVFVVCILKAYTRHCLRTHCF
jgi:hypothetical protein